jgi:hypothetical protein
MLTESQVAPPPTSESSASGRSKRNHTQAQLRNPSTSSSVHSTQIGWSMSDRAETISNSRVVFSTKERDAYISFLRNLDGSIPTEEELQAAQKSLDERRFCNPSTSSSVHSTQIGWSMSDRAETISNSRVVLADSGNMSFVMLTESQVAPPPTSESSASGRSKRNHTQAIAAISSGCRRVVLASCTRGGDRPSVNRRGSIFRASRAATDQ